MENKGKFNKNFIRRAIGVTLASAMVAGLGLTVSAATAHEYTEYVRSKGVIKADVDSDGVVEVMFDSSDIQALGKAVAKAETRVDEMEEALMKATGKEPIENAIDELEKHGLAKNSYFTWSDGTNSFFVDGKTITADDPDSDSRIDSTAERSRVAEILVPEGYYDGTQSVFLGLYNNNNYYYGLGNSDNSGDPQFDTVITYHQHIGDSTGTPSGCFAFTTHTHNINGQSCGGTCYVTYRFANGDGFSSGGTGWQEVSAHPGCANGGSPRYFNYFDVYATHSSCGQGTVRISKGAHSWKCSACGQQAPCSAGEAGPGSHSSYVCGNKPLNATIKPMCGREPGVTVDAIEVKQVE